MAEHKDIGTRLENWANLHQQAAAVDYADAELLDHCIGLLAAQQRTLLWSCYVLHQPIEVVCRKLVMPVRPAAQFVALFQAAQVALEGLADQHALPQAG